MTEPEPASAGRKASHTAGVLVLGNVLATLADVVVPLVVVRLLGKPDVATLTALLFVFNTVALIVATGFPQAVLVHLPGRAAPERRAIAWRMARALFVLGLCAGVILFVLGRFGTAAIDLVSPSSKDQVVDLRPLTLLALLPLGDLPGRMLPNLFVAEGRPRSAAAYGVFRSLGLSSCTLLPVALGGTVETVAQALVLLGVGQGIWVLAALRSLYRQVPRVPCPVSLGEMVRFSVPLGLTDIVAVLNNALDRFLILLRFPNVAFAEYQAGAWQIPIVTRVPYIVGTAMMPEMVASFRSGRPREAIALWQRSIDKVSLVVVPVAMVFVVAAEEVVELLFTAAYVEAAPILRWYSILTLGRVAAFGAVILAAGHPKLVFRASVLSLLSNFVISLPLVFLIGFEGPAMGTALAFVPIVLFYTWCIAQAAEVPFRDVLPFRRYARVVLLALVGALAASLFKARVEGPAALMLAGEALLVLGLFGLLGTLTKTIGRDDWLYLWRWVRLQSLTSRD